MSWSIPPIGPVMRDRISAELDRIAAAGNLRIVLAMESGRRA